MLRIGPCCAHPTIVGSASAERASNCGVEAQKRALARPDRNHHRGLAITRATPLTRRCNLALHASREPWNLVNPSVVPELEVQTCPNDIDIDVVAAAQKLEASGHGLADFALNTKAENKVCLPAPGNASAIHERAGGNTDFCRPARNTNARRRIGQYARVDEIADTAAHGGKPIKRGFDGDARAHAYPDVVILQA